MKNNWFTVKRIRPQLYAIAEFQHFEKVVSYLALGTSHALLFDTGMGYRSIHKVIKTITYLPITVFLTHGHWDHVGGVIKSDTVYKAEDFSDGQVLDKKDFQITVIKTPGHSPDSVCYLIKKKNWLFVGDTVYPGPLYAHLPESDIEAYTTSLSRLCLLVSSKTLILPGHNKTQCDYWLLKNARVLMKQALVAKKKGIAELKGRGFSIRLLR